MARLLLNALVLPSLVHADVYLHSPRGSNNKLNEVSNNARNQARLFDSQNNAAGGYQVGDNCDPVCSNANGNYDADAPGAGEGQMYFYEGSILQLEWTNQHGCGSGQGNVKCNMVIQYMCEDSAPGLRDGKTTNGVPATPEGEANLIYGLHEPLSWYEDCRVRERNMGLYIADQNLGGSRNRAIHTRQNPQGTRRGLECPEERDYYPYWHPTPWRDIAVLTDDLSRCGYYESHSQNVRDYGKCCNSTHLDNTGNCIQVENENPNQGGPNNIGACQSSTVGGTWVESGRWNTFAPRCEAAPFSRDNHLGNAASPFDGADSPVSDTPHFKWTIPGDVLKSMGTDEATCVLRLRYNISTTDYDGWKGFDGSPASDAVTSVFNGADARIKNNPANDFIGFSTNPQAQTSYPLKLNVNTNQLGRVFEDRSHTFKIKRLPSNNPCGIGRIHNLNVRGRRGNIVQVYPAVEYDFVPNRLEVHEGDCVHFQWTGSDANPNGNAGNGRRMTDRTNIVELGSAARLGINMPARHGYRDVVNNLRSYPLYYSMFSNEETVLKMAYLGQDVTCVNGVCTPSLRCDDNSENDQSIANCKELNAASGYFDAGLVRMDRPGTYAYISTRNNDFSNRSQKATIVVHPWKVALSIGGAAAGLVLIAACVLLMRRHVRKHPDKRVAQLYCVQQMMRCCGCCGRRLERSFIVRYPYTLALVGFCGLLYAVGFWMAQSDGDPAPTYTHAKGFGRVLDILCNLIFIPMLRNLTSWLRTTPVGRVLPLDATLYFHKFIGLLIAVATIGHIGMHYTRFNWHASSGSGETVVVQAIGTWTGISGHLIAFAMFLMFLTAAERFRRKKWGSYGGHSIFVRVHKLWIPVLLLLWFHSRAFWHYSFFPTLLLILDKLIGRMRGKEPLTLVSAVSPAKDVLHLTFKLANGRRFKFKAGQYLFLQCPRISTTEWHPFTISSSPEERTFSVHIRCRPDMDWTYALRQLLLPEVHTRDTARLPIKSARTAGHVPAPDTVMITDVEAQKPSAPTEPPDLSGVQLFADGPYGTASEEVFHYEVMVLVAAGIGVTPFASILKTLAHQAKADKLETPLKKVAFYWVCRDEREFMSFKDIMIGIVEDKAISDIFELNTYLTGEINLKTISADEKYHQFAGRPSWDRIGKKLADDYPGTDVGVFLCGPDAIAHQLSAMCKKMNPKVERRASVTSTVPEVHKKQGKFVFHKENF
mmetsp:Transcript_23115/g.63365  ORF Transcript_23115/g.63365 Transcript_23115/m.63365 type:complete len:1215 (+) Transcript_23115:341-3985(+)